MTTYRDQLKPHVDKIILRGRFTLKSGKESTYYLDGRLLSLQPETLRLIAGCILEMTAKDDVNAVGGPALGAVPIVGAVVALSADTPRPLKGFMVRSEAKDHGRKRLVEGPDLKRDEPVFLVEDVTTTGGSVLAAARAVQNEYGARVTRVISLFDRREGSAEAFRQAGIPLTAIFTPDDFHL